jgi:HK97 family phage portal protein
MPGLRGLLSWAWTGSAEPRATLAQPNTTLLEALGAARTASGVEVTADSAMRMSAVAACVRLISESIASLPLHVYERGDQRRRVVTGPATRLLHDEPNPLMSSFTFRETLAANVLLHGNGFAAIIRNGGGDAIELLPVPSPNVTVRRASAQLVYDVRLDGVQSFTVGQADMLHVPGLSFDGLLGLSPIRYAAQSIGLGLAAEQYGAAFFGNGSTPSGYISLPGKLSKDQAAAMRDAWFSVYGGVKNAGKTAVLFEGGKFERISIPPNEAQFIETRKFQISDIARWYRVPPHMIGDLERATFSNIEHQQLEFVMHTLRPWLVRIEQELNRKLFPSSMDGTPGGMLCEFNVDGLLRGDVKSRSDYYVRGRQWGWLSVNDIRRLENMEPLDEGDVYLQPMNMVAAGDTPDAGTDSGSDNSSDGASSDATDEGVTT